MGKNSLGTFLSLAFFILGVSFFTTGCDQSAVTEEGVPKSEFLSDIYGFSFSYPSNWEPVTRDLPDRWAIRKADDMMLFTVNNASLADLLALGKIQALQDIKKEGRPLSDKELGMVDAMVQLASFNDISWYTYAIEFPGKEVKTVISGTLCGDKEIVIVLVSKENSYALNIGPYLSVLNSFSC